MTAAPDDPLPPVTFDGLLDLFAFIEAAAHAGLHVILRLGPYVCAEVNYGGFPVRLREVPGIRFRTINKPFMDRLQSWIHLLADTLRDRRLMASQGGPVILVQLENEYSMVSHKYGEEGMRYLQWVADLQRSLNLGVPAIMCYGAADGVVETINSFYAHELVDSHRENHPEQPPIWTECWTGWYDVWGTPHHTRPVADLLYAVARFFAVGGAGINYYMWMGGTNFGCSTMYLQATSYDYDAPIDEFYQHTAKSAMLARLHRLLIRVYEPVFQRQRKEDPKPIDGVFSWGGVAFVCNDDARTALDGATLPNGKRYDATIAPRSVHIVDCASGACLFDTSDVSSVGGDRTPRRSYRELSSTTSSWTAVQEPVPTCATVVELAETKSDSRAAVIADEPKDLIVLTRGSSDYAAYVARFDIGEGPWVARFEATDLAHVYVDGLYVGGSAIPLWEDRWSNRWCDYEDGGPECSVAVHVAAHGKRSVELCVLVASMGLVKGDWQLGERNMLEEAKGLLTDVIVEGDGWTATRSSAWHCVGKLLGEVQRWGSQLGRSDIPSARVVNAGNVVEPPAWYACTLTTDSLRDAWVLDLKSVGKGLLYVNSILLGRFWNVQGTLPRNGFLNGSPIVQQPVDGEPTQRYYHVPQWVVKEQASENGDVEMHIVLFVEYGPVPTGPIPLLEAVPSISEDP